MRLLQHVSGRVAVVVWLGVRGFLMRVQLFSPLSKAASRARARQCEADCAAVPQWVGLRWQVWWLAGRARKMQGFRAPQAEAENVTRRRCAASTGLPLPTLGRLRAKVSAGGFAAAAVGRRLAYHTQKETRGACPDPSQWQWQLSQQTPQVARLKK